MRFSNSYQRGSKLPLLKGIQLNQLTDVSGHVPSHFRRYRLIASAILALLATVWLSTGPLTRAQADVQGNMSICSYSWVAPYGQAGDKCAANLGGYLWAVSGQSYEHSACVSVLNNKGDVSSSWLCTPGSNNYTGVKWFAEDGVWRRGVLRNNTTGSGAHVSGTQTCITCG